MTQWNRSIPGSGFNDSHATYGSRSRRGFLIQSGQLATWGLIAGIGLPASVLARAAEGDDKDPWAAQVQALMAEGNIPGLSLASVTAYGQVLASGSGWADLERRQPMHADTLLNIASVTKTITATALMRLHERGKFELDDAIDSHLPFTVRNPKHPDAPITFKQLLSHTSSISDGPAYGASYACGDADMALGEWLAAYFIPGGTNHDPERNFHAWAPGTTWSYSNVAYGLIGHLVECLSGESYSGYCRDHIFRPLGMEASGIHITEIDAARHATNYEVDRVEGEGRGSLRDPGRMAAQLPSGTAMVPLCLYGFATPPDGGARTSAEELGRFLQAYLQGGELNGYRLLSPKTIGLMHTRYATTPSGKTQGLAWFGEVASGGSMRWSHSGGDPGTRTFVVLDTALRRGAVVLTNGGSGPIQELAGRVLDIR